MFVQNSFGGIRLSLDNFAFTSLRLRFLLFPWQNFLYGLPLEIVSALVALNPFLSNSYSCNRSRFDGCREVGLMRAEALDQGRPLPLPDVMIAATALLTRSMLVTHNIKDFVTIPGLQLEDWQMTP